MAYLNGKKIYLPIQFHEGGGLSSDAKTALMNLLQHVAYTDENGQTYYNALYNALYPPSPIVSINAVFTQGDTVIYSDSSLNALKQYLVVTAIHASGDAEVVTNYTLSGSLQGGTSTITVTYEELETTFDVVVNKGVPSEYEIKDYICVDGTAASKTIAAGGRIRLKQYTNLNELSVEFKVKTRSGHGNGLAIFGARNSQSGSTDSYTFLITTANTLAYHLHGNADSNNRPELTIDQDRLL